MLPRSRYGVALLVIASLVVASCSSGNSEDSRSTRGTRPSRNSQSSPTRSTAETSDPSQTTSTQPSTTSGSAASSGQPSQPGGTTGTIGVVGCSNTDLAVSGYTELSSIDKLTRGDLGGGSEPGWGDPSDRDYGQYWGIYDSRRPADGYDEVWFQICLRTPEHLGAFDEDEQVWTSHIVEQIHLRDPGIPVWISGINTYSGGASCSSTGPDGPAIAAEAADWAAQNLPGVFAGPKLGPLLPEHIVARDDCHPNSAGQELLGGQLVDFFD